MLTFQMFFFPLCKFNIHHDHEKCVLFFSIWLSTKNLITCIWILNARCYLYRNLIIAYLANREITKRNLHLHYNFFFGFGRVSSDSHFMFVFILRQQNLSEFKVIRSPSDTILLNIKANLNFKIFFILILEHKKTFSINRIKSIPSLPIAYSYFFFKFSSLKFSILLETIILWLFSSMWKKK